MKAAIKLYGNGYRRSFYSNTFMANSTDDGGLQLDLQTHIQSVLLTLLVSTRRRALVEIDAAASLSQCQSRHGCEAVSTIVTVSTDLQLLSQPMSTPTRPNMMSPHANDPVIQTIRSSELMEQLRVKWWLVNGETPRKRPELLLLR